VSQDFSGTFSKGNVLKKKSQEISLAKASHFKTEIKKLLMVPKRQQQKKRMHNDKDLVSKA